MTVATKPVPADIGQYLEYDPVSGALHWKPGAIQSGGKKPRDGEAGTINDHGYRVISFRYVKMLAHRVAWFLTTGEQPPNIIDHCDGNSANNSWANLRAATTSQNAANQKQRSGKVLSKGVTPSRSGGFIAQIGVAGRIHFLGKYPTEEMAAAAYQTAAARHFGQFARAA